METEEICYKCAFGYSNNAKTYHCRRHIPWANCRGLSFKRWVKFSVKFENGEIKESYSLVGIEIDRHKLQELQDLKSQWANLQGKGKFTLDFEDYSKPPRDFIIKEIQKVKDEITKQRKLQNELENT